MTDLWGDISSKPIKTPVSILREQGSLLEKKTNGVLTVVVSAYQVGDGNDARFTYNFTINVPSLNYKYKLFSITHPINLYPVIFNVEKEIIDDNKTIANNESEFLEILGQILKSPKTQGILNALLSQSITA